MTTLKAVRREMMNRLPSQDSIGRVEDIASGTATTVVVSALATGTVNAEKFIRKWLLRAEAASAADRVRMSSNFASSTGTLTHAGANYTDTTFTSEKVEIHEHEPYIVDTAINVALGRLYRADRTIIPCRNTRRVYLGDLGWVADPGSIQIAWNSSPVLNRDRHLEKWGTVNSSGALQLTDWTLAGSGATLARSTTQNRRGKYSAALTRVTNDVTLSQTVGLLETGVSDDSLRGETLTIVLVCWASVADRVRVQALDGTQTVSSSFHTGDSTWQELTTTITVAPGATTLTVQASLEDGDTTVYLDDMYISRRAIDDSTRRDNFEDTGKARAEVDQWGELTALVEPRTTGQWVVYTPRPYPQFDADRLRAGMADADETDAPLVTLATGAIARLFEAVHGEFDPRTVRWAKKAQDLYLAHLAEDSNSAWPGLGLPRQSVRWGVR